MQATLQMSVLVPNTTVFLRIESDNLSRGDQRQTCGGSHLTSTTDWRRSCISMCCLFAESNEAVGPYGINAASEYAEETRDR